MSPSYWLGLVGLLLFFAAGDQGFKMLNNLGTPLEKKYETRGRILSTLMLSVWDSAILIAVL